MNQSDLRALQAPLKERYREDAQAAQVTLRAEGDLDWRGTLALDREAPVGFKSIRLSFELDVAAEPEQLATLARLTEFYCVVLQTLSFPPETTASIRLL